MDRRALACASRSTGVLAVKMLGTRLELRGADLGLVADANPDGVHANSRQSAAGVNQNRNFPFRGRHSGYRGTVHYTPGPLSEP